MFNIKNLFLQIPALPDSVPSKKAEIEIAKNLPLDELMDQVISHLVTFAINFAIALIVFYIGKFIIRKVYNLIATVMNRRDIDRSLTTFTLSMVKIVLYFILLVIVIGILGVETSSFIAIFASAGVAVGMALSGTLQNFAGGILILLLKPYKVGDYIETQGFAGTVREIQIFFTIINTYDNKTIIIPNGGLSTGSINNYTREPYRRVDWTVSISYGDNVDTARMVIIQLLEADPRILKANSPTPDTETHDDATDTTPTPGHPLHKSLISRMVRRHKKNLHMLQNAGNTQVVVSPPVQPSNPTVLLDVMNSSSIDLKVRAWVTTENYWAVYYEMNEAFYNTLPKHGLSFPFPQLDVHLPKA